MRGEGWALCIKLGGGEGWHKKGGWQAQAASYIILILLKYWVEICGHGGGGGGGGGGEGTAWFSAEGRLVRISMRLWILCWSM